LVLLKKGWFAKAFFSFYIYFKALAGPLLTALFENQMEKKKLNKQNSALFPTCSPGT